MKPDIHEQYKSYTPPKWVRPTVERLLASLAPEHTAGLESVILTDSASIGKGKTGRVGNRKYRRSECRGFYQPASKRGRAWIQIVVDNIGMPPKPLDRLQVFRDIQLAKTLYHEVGHHLDQTVGSATRQGEMAAEDWRKRLSRIHFRRKYPVLSLFVRFVFRPIFRSLRRNLTESRS